MTRTERSRYNSEMPPVQQNVTISIFLNSIMIKIPWLKGPSIMILFPNIAKLFVLKTPCSLEERFFDIE